MADWLTRLHHNPLTAPLVRAIGLPSPVELDRCQDGYAPLPLAGKKVCLHGLGAGFAIAHARRALVAAGAAPLDLPTAAGGKSVPPLTINVLVVDATACRQPDDYRALYDCFHGCARALAANGRVVLLTASPDHAADPVAAAVARGVEGFTRSLAKELGPRGITVNLLYVAPDAVERLAGPLRFFCGAQTAYVTGQAVRVADTVPAPASVPFQRALDGKVAVVTGAARGIGRATAERLAQEGAQLVCVDVPGAAAELDALCRRIEAVPLQLDIAAADTPQRLAALLRERFGGLDILVHNAGITRDRTVANMSAAHWDAVIAINLAAVMAIDEQLLSAQLIRPQARVVCVSSIGGIAGNFGQTNYAASKAALIGYVAARAAVLAPAGITVNAIAPGFIETEMTAAMPFLPREFGRRLNSLKQGGRPRDVAELVTFLCTPGSSGISGQTIRVCGQSVLGA